MSYRICSTLFLLLLFFQPIALAGDLDKRLAVLPFDGKMIEDDYAETLSSLLRNELGNIDEYEVIDRSNMEMILKEQQIQLHDCTDSSCAVRFGEILNVRWIVVGSLSKFGKKYLFITRRVDVQTGQIVKTSQFTSDTMETLIDVIPNVAGELLGLESLPEVSGSTPIDSRESGATTELPTLPPVVNQSGRSSSTVPPPVIRGGGEPPTIEWISQPPGTMSLKDGKRVMFRFRGNDDRCIKIYHYRLNDQPMKETRRGQVILENTGEGSHTFQVMVEDCDGNVSSPLRCDFTVRNMPPDVAIQAPGENETVHAKKLLVRLNGTDSDGTVAMYRCAVNNPSNPIEQTSPEFTFDVADGPVMIYAQVVDDAGLESSWTEQRMIFRYQTEPAPTSTPKPGDWANAYHGQVKTVNLGGGVSLDMVYIKSGTFKMGSPSGEKDRDDDEGPVHSVTLDGFWMGKYEVTWEQYSAVMEAHYGPLVVNCPVTLVSWDEATEFCKKLSHNQNQVFMLPSESQWEYACRAGTESRFSFGDKEDDLNKYAWNTYNSNRARNIGRKKPNGWQLFDMHGNVSEWCRDDWHDNYIGAPNDGSCWNNPRNKFKILRGGSWNDLPRYCRSADRCQEKSSYKDYAIGFRIICPV